MAHAVAFFQGIEILAHYKAVRVIEPNDPETRVRFGNLSPDMSEDDKQRMRQLNFIEANASWYCDT